MPTPFPGRLKRAVLVGAACAVVAAVTGTASFASILGAFQDDPPGPQASAATAPDRSATVALARRPPKFGSPEMALGNAAPAPLGYLRFCSRRPEQCGLQGEAWASFRSEPVQKRESDLVARYYWAVAFAGGGTLDVDLFAASGSSYTAASGHSAPVAEGGSLRVDSQRSPTVAAKRDHQSPSDEAVAALQYTQGTEWKRPPPVAPADVAPVTMDGSTATLLYRVNSFVNGAIRFVSDRVQYGVDDIWTLPLSEGGSHSGECKDYVLEKRRALVVNGILPHDLSIAIVKTRWGEAHAVLLVATDRGELVMDSLSSEIRPWQRTPYQWVERQSPGQQLVWVRILAGPRTES